MAPKVAFQGERGAYGEMATLQYFPNIKSRPLKSFQDVFDAAENGEVEYIVVPVENSMLKTKMNVVG